MARVKVTTANIKAKLIDWGQGATNRADELVFIGKRDTFLNLFGVGRDRH